MAALEDEDPFWRIQLVDNIDQVRMPFTSEASRYDYQDHALPVGTEVTETSLAGVFGREREVYVPMASTIIIGSSNADDNTDRDNSNADERDRDNSSNNQSSIHSSSDGSSSSSSSSSGENGRARLGQALVLTLRQVNGDGVMSGVGGDVWCAALLLSAWLLENPEVVRGLDVLELGSGLGLCGITAGYLAKSVTLTDYVDELLLNLRHNIEANRAPRVACTVAPGKPIGHHWNWSGRGEDADDGPATEPQRQRSQQQHRRQEQDWRQQSRQQHHQRQQQQQQQLPEPEHLQQHLQESDALREEPMAGMSLPRRRYHWEPDDCVALPDTAGGGGGGPVRVDQQERRLRRDLLVRLTHTAATSDPVVLEGGNDFLPSSLLPPPRKTPLFPLSQARATVRKLDWTAFAGQGEARPAFGEGAGNGWWWDDQGPDANQSEATKAPARLQLSGPNSLCCDVAVGSALVYSPHHACVADVLSHLFADGGCRAAYIVQLSTRPGFDNFLHRLGACGLRYRLERVSTVLSAPILNEIRRSTRGAVPGGPVIRAADPAVASDDDGNDAGEAGNDCQDGSHDDTSGGDFVEGGQGAATSFEEFVLCRVFRPQGSNSREEGPKSTR